MLQELRGHDGGADLILTAAVATTPFLDEDGKPLADVSAFADIFDHIGPSCSTIIRPVC